MQLDPPAEGDARRRLRGLLVWSGLTLLAAVALALAMVIASLALDLGSEPAPPQPHRSSSARRAATQRRSERPTRRRSGLQRQARRQKRERKHMNNQHAGLSQALAEQRITERHEQATHARLISGARPPRRRRRAWVARRWWQLARWPGVPADQPVSRPQASS